MCDVLSYLDRIHFSSCCIDQCGTNVGDQCYIPLPPWVVAVGGRNRTTARYRNFFGRSITTFHWSLLADIWYRDKHSQIDQEYLSLGVDNQRLFNGRTPIEMYSDFMTNFSITFAKYISNGVIDQIQVGLGPAGIRNTIHSWSGELRYPSYQLQDNRWHYCGIGAFQCYDKHMLNSLQQAANQAGNSAWGSPPTTAGTCRNRMRPFATFVKSFWSQRCDQNDLTKVAKGRKRNTCRKRLRHQLISSVGFYNDHPSNTQFFSDNQPNNYASSFGAFFLRWYSQQLINHGEAILSKAHSIFSPRGLGIAGTCMHYTTDSVSAKVSGIHWWYNTYSHAAECTAGYLNTNFNNAYLEVWTCCVLHIDSLPTCLQSMVSILTSRVLKWRIVIIAIHNLNNL